MRGSTVALTEHYATVNVSVFNVKLTLSANLTLFLLYLLKEVDLSAGNSTKVLVLMQLINGEIAVIFRKMRGTFEEHSWKVLQKIVEKIIIFSNFALNYVNFFFFFFG